MARPRLKYLPEPRILRSSYQVATYLGHGEQWFADWRAQLEAEGFPQRDELLGGWDREAIDVWLDARAGIGSGDGGTKGHNPCDDLLGPA